MTEELKQAAQQALEVLKSATSFMSKKARDQHPKTVARLERALTAAQPARDDAPRTCPDACKSPEKCCNFGCQKPDQQATAEPECARSHPHEDMSPMCELRTEIARLRNENVRLKATTEPGLPEGWAIASYAAGEITIQRMAQIDGRYLWKVSNGVSVLNKESEWEWEPMPSSRDDAFLARCRYASLAEVSAALAAAQAKGGGHG